MNKYPTKIEELNPAIRTGRLVYIDDPTKVTPREVLAYLDEGFCPVLPLKLLNPSLTGVRVGYFMAHYINAGGAYFIETEYNGNTITYVSEDLDTPYVLD